MMINYIALVIYKQVQICFHTKTYFSGIYSLKTESRHDADFVKLASWQLSFFSPIGPQLVFAVNMWTRP